MQLHPVLSLLLLPFSWLYSGISSMRNFLYEQKIKDIYHADLPVISVGNLSTGGTGKTPTAEYLIRKVLEQKAKPAYLSRGYGRKSKGYYRVLPAEGNAKDFGDEALQVAEKFPQIPVAVSEDRRIGIENLCEENPDVIILDDAFQHRKVHRDLDILLLDANRLPYEDRILPAGTLREHIRGISRADILIINKIKDPSQIANIGKRLAKWKKPLCFTQVKLEEIKPFHEQEKPITKAVLKQKEVILFSGIGNADFFEKQVQELGTNLIQHFRFGDHYTFKKEDVAKLMKLSQPGRMFLCTEKDYFRLKDSPFFSELLQAPFFYVPIHLDFLAGEEILLEKLKRLILKN